MFGFDDLAVAGVSAIGNLISGNSNAKAAREAFKSRYQDTVKDMKKAGLNPALAYGQGGGNPTTHDKPLLGESLKEGALASMSAKATKAQIEQTRTAAMVNIAQADKTNAEANFLRSTMGSRTSEIELRNAQTAAQTELAKRQGETEVERRRQLNAAVTLAQMDISYQGATWEARVNLVRQQLKQAQLDYSISEIEKYLREQEKPEAKARANYFRGVGRFDPYINAAKNVASTLNPFKLQIGGGDASTIRARAKGWNP